MQQVLMHFFGVKSIFLQIGPSNKVGIMEPYLTVNTGFIHAIALNVLPAAYHLIPPPVVALLAYKQSAERHHSRKSHSGLPPTSALLLGF